MPLVIGYTITFIEPDYVGTGAIIFLGGTMLGVLFNVIFWNTKPKKLITP